MFNRAFVLTLPLRPIARDRSIHRVTVAVYQEYTVDRMTAVPYCWFRFYIAVCGAVVLWVERNSAAPLDFIERHLGFSSDNGDGSMEVVLVAVLVMVIAVAAFRLASKVTTP